MFANRVLITFVFLALIMASAEASAEDRQDVIFEITRSVGTGEAVFVLGDLPELGGGDTKRAVRLADVGDDTWRVTVSLPGNRDYRYQYFVRSGEGAALCSVSNATSMGPVVEAKTDSAAGAPSFKQLIYRSDAALPVLYWRTDFWPFHALPLRELGPGPTSGESTWIASGFAETGDRVEFYLSDESGTFRDPPTGSYSTKLDAFLIQDGHTFNYVPADLVSPQRRDYDPADPPGIDSVHLNALRRYRVMLPRGYDEHVDRRYPVAYVHDGLRVFDGLFVGGQSVPDPGLVDDVIADLNRDGVTREFIAVAIDEYPIEVDGLSFAEFCRLRTEARSRDYLPPGDSYDVGRVVECPGGAIVDGEADKYARFVIEELKPFIDANYRTLSDRDNTAVVGFSFGGVAALYMGWDFSETFGLVGSQSGSYWKDGLTCCDLHFNFTDRLMNEPKRDIKIYLDSGDSGGDIIDNYAGNFALRNNFISKSPEPYRIEDDLRYVHACGHRHELAFAAQRMPEMYSFLFPATAEPGGMGSDCNANRIADADEISSNPTLDEDADGLLDICEPDCNSNGKPDNRDIAMGSSADCNLNGRPDECEADCNGNGSPDDCDLAAATSGDCNGNGVPDECDVSLEKGKACDLWASEDVPCPATLLTFNADNQGGLRAADGCMLVLGIEGDLVGRNDRFHYVHEVQGGDFTLTARISDWQDAAEGSKLGLMVREDLGVGARMGTVLLEKTTDGFQHVFLRRTTLVREFPHETYESPDVWLRIEKTGDDILGSVSLDGVTWTDPDTITLAGLPRRIHVGVFSSHTGDIPSLATVCDVALEFEPPPTQFIRGDGNGDGSVNIADASYLANFLFGVAPATPPPCEAAGDGNGDGRINIADASFIANFLFGIGNPSDPPAPYPDCGFPEGEPLRCDDAFGCLE